MLAADYAHISPDGKLNMIGGDLGRVFAPTVPVVVPTMTIVSKIAWQPGDPAEVPLRLTLNGPGIGPVAPAFEITVKRNGEDAAMLAVTLPPLHFAALGRYRFRLVASESELGAIDLDVLQSAPPEGKGN